jgi:hypothetical protein
MKASNTMLVFLTLLLASGCLEPQQTLNLIVQRNNYENIIEIRNTGEVDYTKCRLIVNKNWTYGADRLAFSEDLILHPHNFSSKTGDYVESDAEMKSLEIYCNEGYYGGVFED